MPKISFITINSSLSYIFPRLAFRKFWQAKLRVDFLKVVSHETYLPQDTAAFKLWYEEKYRLEKSITVITIIIEIPSRSN